MKYIFRFKLREPMSLPVQYNYILQTALLNWIHEENYQDFLHNEGYKKEKRTYKLYSFSKLFGKYRIHSKEKTITFFEEVHLYISSYDKKYLSYLIQNIFLEEPLRLLQYNLVLSSVETEEEEYVLDEEGMANCRVQAISPVTVSSTLTDQLGHKKTYYYSPYEKEFSALIEQNLRNKYVAFHGVELEEGSFSIVPEGSSLKESITWYKRFLIKGWTGKFIIKGSKELMDIALSAGIGVRNSMGYGCILLDKGNIEKGKGDHAGRNYSNRESINEG